MTVALGEQGDPASLYREREEILGLPWNMFWNPNIFRRIV